MRTNMNVLLSVFLLMLCAAGGTCVTGAQGAMEGADAGSDEVGWDIPPVELPDVREAPLAVPRARAVAAYPDATGESADAEWTVPEDVAERMSIHQEEMTAHPDEAGVRRTAATPRAVAHSVLVPRATGEGPQKRVLGWHPYWGTQADIENYQYSNLTHIAYFSYEVDPLDGGCANLHAWNTSPVVEWAHSNGVKVVLTATLFGSDDNQQLLTNTTACAALVTNLVQTVVARGGDGVCIDFEGVGSWSGATKALTAFMSNLTVACHAQVPALEVSIALPSVDWYADFDVGSYERFGLDYSIVMGYDYYYAGSSTPGPNAPLYSSAQWIGASSWCSVDYSVRYYLAKMTNAAGLMLAVPYYGRKWRAASEEIGAASEGSAYSVSVSYPTAEIEAASYGKEWDSSASVPFYRYSGEYAYQCFYDDTDSLGLKYDYAEAKGLGGVGIWALSHAPDDTRLWGLLAEKFGATSGDGGGGTGEGGEDPGEGTEQVPSGEAAWTTQTSSFGGMFYGVNSREGLHVATGAGGAVYSSADGVEWTAQSTGASGLLMNADGSGPLWCVVGESGTILTSADGRTWTARTSPASVLFRGVAYGDGVGYAACGDGGGVVTSPDGVEWTAQTSGITGSLQGICFGNGLFVAVGASGAILTSSDGVTWTARTSGVSTWLSDVIYGNGYFVAVGSGSVVLRSPDGVTWTRQTEAAAGVYLYRAAYCAGVFKAAGANGTVWTSADGATWSTENSGTTNVLRGISYANDQFVAVGANGTICTKGSMVTTGGGGVTTNASSTTWDFTLAEGWSGQTSSFTGETNVNGQVWSLTDCRVYPESSADGDSGYVSLYSPGKATAVSPAVPGCVTQVVTVLRPASAAATREVTLLASVDGGASFSSVATYAPTEVKNFTNTLTFSPPLDGGASGVMFCASNSGSAGTVHLRRLAMTGYTVSGESGEGGEGGGGTPAVSLGIDATGVTADSFLLRWDAVAGVTNYDVQVSTSASFADAPVITTPGLCFAVTGLTAGVTYYNRTRAVGSAAWGNTLAVRAGMLPGTLRLASTNAEAFHASWPAAPGATSYVLDVTPGPFTNWTSTCPAAPLGTNTFLPGQSWSYTGTVRTVTTSANLAAGPGWCATSTYAGHYLVGFPGQSILSTDFLLYGATGATLSFSNGAWNAANSTQGIEVTRINVYYSTDGSPWNFLASQTAASTSDTTGWKAFRMSLPPGALDATSIAFKITAPNAERHADSTSGSLRGAGIKNLSVTFTGAGRYAPDNRLEGFPKTVTGTNITVRDLAPATAYFVRVQAVSNTAARSVWVVGNVTTAAESSGGGDDPSGDGESGLVESAASQPVGALSGVVVYTSGGHGFTADGTETSWITGRGLANAVNEDMGNLDQLNAFVNAAWKAGATVVPMRPVGYQTNEVILDNVDRTFTAGKGQVTYGGIWSDTTQTTLYYGASGEVGYRYASICTTGTTAWASYRPDLPAAGEYPVYTWVRHGSDRVNQLYRVHHAGGVTDVRVNHNQVGCGWVWLGNFFFAAGTNGCVNISNHAPDENSGNVVLADAIRFGNGMGDIARGTAGISGFERELEASRYWVQRTVLDSTGLAASLYDLSGYNDSSDNVGAPPRMAYAMCRTNGWARWRRIYVGFHSNAGTGANRGVWGLYDTRLQSTYPAYYRAQTNLASIIARRTDSDMVAGVAAGVIPSWTAAGRIYGASYGEIYNASIFTKMDTTIDEVAFHDNTNDCIVLKTPAGREWLARGALRGIISHLHNYYTGSGVPEIFAPDRPERLRAVNSAPGSVTLSWAMPPRTAASGALPTSFRLYSSSDGLAFGNPIDISGGSSTNFTLTGLAVGHTLFFRLCAVNDGGESPDSAVAGVRVTPNGVPAAVLVVDGFKRNDSSLAPTRYFAKNLGGNVALVRPRLINNFDYIKEHGLALAAASTDFDYADNTLLSATLLAEYSKVVWILGTESTTDETFSPAEQTAVTAWLATGGRLFVSGSEIGWDLAAATTATTADKAFLTNTLRAVYVRDSSSTGIVTGTASGLLNGLTFNFHHTGLRNDLYAATYPDVFSAAPGATLAAAYGSSATGTSGAAIQFSNATYRTIIMGLPFETIPSAAQRADIMTRVMAFFADTPTADTDGNGIPDDWEMQYFGTPTGVVATADPDNDTMTNLQEYLAGTDPTNAASFLLLTLENAPIAAGDTLTLAWPSASNRLYALSRATSLVPSDWTNLQSNIIATPPLNTLSITTTISTQLFFRIRATVP